VLFTGYVFALLAAPVVLGSLSDEAQITVI
jgi:hypothetical protein